MKKNEEHIISQLQSKKIAKYEISEQLMKLLQEESLGDLSSEFINHSLLNDFIPNTADFIKLRYQIEHYLHSKHNTAIQQEMLYYVEDALKTCLRFYHSEEKAQGLAMLPTEIANAAFIRKIYSLNDENLSHLFLKYLPAPRASLFKGQEIPEIIAKKEQAAKQTLSILKDHDLAFVEHYIVKLQRKFRAHQRHQENLQRLPNRYPSKFWNKHKTNSDGDAKKFAEGLLNNANKPYQPQCELGLSKRIMEAAQKLELFSTVKHYTAISALESIFDDGIYGRRSLIQNYMSFRKASLGWGDIEDGDANVVCLGANEIDPLSRHGIELHFNATKIAKNNPCVFYKQRDLGYYLEKTRHVCIGTFDLYFSHTGIHMQAPLNLSYMKLWGVNLQAVESFVPKAILIADNMKEMHQILTLNFFRLIDALPPQSIHKNIIYDELNKLSINELEETLLQIGKNMTDTMEFNFYGAYKIDFSALLMIKKEKPAYSLELLSFINELKKGNVEALNDAMSQLPEIFNSYRFIDYLLSTTNHENITTALQERRKNCSLPLWMEQEGTTTYSDKGQISLSR
jgi:hypothetical protein